MPDLLHKYKVLIADPDEHMASVLKKMLLEMGFENIQTITNGQEALQLVKKNDYDILISEWAFEEMENLELLQRVRRDPDSLHPTLPIITVTGRAELSEVMLARDYGTNEYVIKPFTAMSLYKRLERLVEQPRNFVVSVKYVGPERRVRNVEDKVRSERRKLQLKPQNTVFDRQAINNPSVPKLLEADYSLKEKIGMNTALSSLITPEVLAKAQASIDAISSESMHWIKEDLSRLKTLFRALQPNEMETQTQIRRMANAALSISSNAGTFRYENASKIGYMLSLFCRNNLNPELPLHCVIVEKHIDVLYVALGDDSLDSDSEKSALVIKELQHLIDRYGK